MELVSFLSVYDWNFHSNLLYVSHYRSSIFYSDIKRSIVSEKEAQEQRDKLQSLLNAVPRFVSSIDEAGIYHSINEHGKLLYKQENIIEKKIEASPSDIFIVSVPINELVKTKKNLETQQALA